MTYLCKYCNRIVPVLKQVYESGFLTWAGCPDCYKKKKELEKDVEE